MTTKIDTQWMLLEEGIVHTVLLTESEAKALQKEWQLKYPNLEYTLGYDEYYEYCDINN